MIQIYSSSVRELGPRDIDGASSFIIGERDTLILATDCPCEARTALQRLGVGASVAIRHSLGLRSCMNKPSLWGDVLGYC